MSTRPLTSLRALLLGSPLLLALGALPETVHAGPVTVDCAKHGQTIGKRIKAAIKPLEIVVKGDCVENLEIDRDDVTIMTAGSPASITAADPARPTILLDGAHRIVIDGVVPGGLTISGGSTGVTATRGATLDLMDCVVQGNTGNGVISAYGSTVSIDACTVQNNTGNGVVASNAASLAITNSTVTGNSGNGIVAARSSDVRVGQNLSGTALGAVTVSNHSQGTGFAVSENSAGILVSSTVSNNGTGGVFVGRGSGAMIGIGSSITTVSGNTITGNGGIGINMEGGNATIVDSTISNNARFGIHLGDGGNGRIGILPSTGAYSKNTVTGNGSAGILVRGGSASIAGADIIGNGTNPADGNRHGVAVTGGHVYLPGGNTISNHPVWGVNVNTTGNALLGDGNILQSLSVNTITGNGTDASLTLTSRGGVVSSRGSAVALTNAVIRANLGTGVVAALNSTVEVTNSTVEDNDGEGIGLFGQSSMRMRHPSVSRNNDASGVNLGQGSGAEFRGYAGSSGYVTGNALGLNCNGAKASVQADSNDFSFVSGNTAQNGMGNCTGF